MKKSLLALFLLITNLVVAQNTGKTNNSWKADFGDVKCFIENQGQFKIGNNEELNSQIKFAFDGHNERYLFTPKGVIIELISKEKIIKTKEQRAARKERKKQGFASQEEFYEYEKNWRKVKDTRDYLYAYWIGGNQNVEVITEGKNSFYHSYCIENESGQEININKIPSYNKLIYKNIYPNIDVVYEFHPIKGLKYSLVVKPGAELSNIKLQYSKNAKLLLNGSLETPTKFGDIIDHAPLTFYEDNKNKIIKSAYQIKNNIISFKIDNYDKSKTIIIDPWTQTPNFPNTNWDSVWECERDGAGNVYIIGGTSPLELRKYNSAGVQQWIYNTTYDTTEWLGTFATDLAGISYVANGSPARIRSVSTAGATIWNNNNPGGIFSSTEFWNITFNCDQTQLVVAGTGGILPPLPYIYRINMANGNVLNSVQVCGSSITPTGTQEVRSITPCNNGKYYFLTHDTIGYIHQSLNTCLQGGQPFHVNNGIDLGYKCENFRYNNTGIMALAYYNGFVFVHRGNQLQKRNFNTAAIVATANIPGGVFNNVFLSGNEVGCSGIDIDDCGNIYVGSTNGVYRFNQSLTQTGSFATSFNVYDVEVNSGGEVIACGSTGNQNSATRTGSIQSFAASACTPQAIVCCDATVCPAGPLCTNDPAVTLNAVTPGGTWSASCGTCINSSGVFNPATAGVGTHTITYTLGCGSESIQIVVNTCTPLSVCVESNGTLTVTGGTGPYTWSQWNPGGTTPINSQATCLACNSSYTWVSFTSTCLNGVVPVTSCNTPAGYQQYATGTNAPAPNQFPAQVQDNTGQTFTINNLGSLPNCTSCPTITVSTSSINQPACNGGTGSATVSASGGAGPYTYLWTPGNLSGATQNNLQPGTYTVTATDNNNCTGTTTVNITNPAAITITVTNNSPATCGNNNGSITVSASGGSGNLSYSWSPSGQTGATANNLAGGPHTVTVTDANGCSASQTITVNSTGGATLSIQSQNNVTCFGGNNGSATILATGGQTPYSYSWSPSGGSSATATNLSSGTYTVTVTDNAGCVSTINVTITQPASGVSVTTTNTNSSCTSNTGTATANPTGGTGPYTYSWNTSPTQTTQTAINLGLGTYTVTVTDASGCQATATATVSNPNAPTITLVSQNNITCNGNNNGSATVNASGGTGTLTITWSTNPVQTGATASNLPAGTYTATVTDQNNCTATVSITITQPAALTTNISTTPANCAASDGTATANVSGGSGPYTYSWSNSATTQTITNLPVGPISVNITDANGCTSNAVGNIITVSNANINAVPPFVTIALGESTTLSATGCISYTWSPANGLSCTNCPNPTASPSQTTVYYVTGIDANGCFGMDSVIIYVDLPCGEIFVPNAFSPNNDGQNDKLCIFGGCFLSLDFMIFDRWGEKVFEATSTSLCWDGTFRGKPMNPAVFFYVLKATLNTGENIEKKGNISLIR